MRVRRPVLSFMMCAAMCAIVAAPARAQDAARGRFEIAAGVTWTGSMSLGTPAATETAPSGRFTLFSTSTGLSSATGVEARVGVRLTPRVLVEASSAYSRPVLRAAVSGDVENGAPLTATDTLRQITVDGALVIDVMREERVHRASPFIIAGAGYLRQLHEGDTLAVNGQRYFAGGGVKLLLMSRAHKLKGVGLRADARALVQRHGASFDERVHTSPLLSASVFLRF
jgi:hypothetical protein